MPDTTAREPAVRPAKRRGKLIAGIVAVIIAIPVIAIVILAHYDWNRAKPWLNARVSEAIERPFAINGDLSLHWEKSIVGERDRTWRDLIPWPHLIANDAHVG